MLQKLCSRTRFCWFEEYQGHELVSCAPCPSPPGSEVVDDEDHDDEDRNDEGREAHLARLRDRHTAVAPVEMKVVDDTESRGDAE